MTATKLPPWDKDPNCWVKSSDPHQVLETCHSPPSPRNGSHQTPSLPLNSTGKLPAFTLISLNSRNC